MKSITIYVDDPDVAPIPIPHGYMKWLRIGSVVTINDERYEVWYIEETATHRNVRVERV